MLLICVINPHGLGGENAFLGDLVNIGLKTVENGW